MIRAIAAANEKERSFWARTIGKGDQRDGDLAKAKQLLHDHGTLASTRDAAKTHAANAKDALAPLPDHPIKGMLLDLADYVVARLN